jgi:LPXTG-site transpeptidase (sortase) family protein
MRARRKTLLQRIERLLWLVAAATLGSSLFLIVEGQIYQIYLNWEFEDALDAQQLLASTRKRTAHTLRSASDSARAAARPYLGRLDIPRLGMSIMVMEGVDDQTLRRGIGHIPETVLPGQSGNSGIAGHRDTFFRGLAGIRRHDEITVRTLDGAYDYVVDSIRVVDPDAVEVLNDFGYPMLTLVTCYPFYRVGPAPQRFVVQALLKD